MVLQLRIALLETEPVIWRRILVDDTSTLHQLHRMIQILLGWWDYHLYRFDVEGALYHGPGDAPFLDEDIGEDASRVTLRELERELARKEKALAEAAALLILNKTAQALWGDEDDTTAPKKGRGS